MSDVILYAAIGAGLAALVLAAIYARGVMSAPRGNPRMVELSDAIRSGSMAFLRKEYTWATVFVVVVATLVVLLTRLG